MKSAMNDGSVYIDDLKNLDFIYNQQNIDGNLITFCACMFLLMPQEYSFL